MKKNAFTLAELLITLGIIGVVAAITIPAVVSNSTNQKYITGAKKAFNTLKMVQRQAEADYGEMSDWGLKGNNDFKKYLLPHFEVLADCGTDSGCFAEEILYYTKGEDEDESGFSTKSGYKFTTADGIAYAFIADGTTIRIFADVNGLDLPNKLGKDVFTFDVTGQGIKPGGFGMKVGDIKTNCLSKGYACTSIVINKGTMNY